MILGFGWNLGFVGAFGFGYLELGCFLMVFGFWDLTFGVLVWLDLDLAVDVFAWVIFGLVFGF